MVLFVLEVFDPSDELVAVQAVGDVTASQELVLEQEAQLSFVHHVFDHKLDEFLNKTNKYLVGNRTNWLLCQLMGSYRVLELVQIGLEEIQIVAQLTDHDQGVEVHILLRQSNGSVDLLLFDLKWTAV